MNIKSMTWIGLVGILTACLLQAAGPSGLAGERWAAAEKCPHCEAPKGQCRKDHCPFCGTVRVGRRCGRCDNSKERDRLLADRAVDCLHASACSALPSEVPPPTCADCGAKASSNGSITHRSGCIYAPKK